MLVPETRFHLVWLVTLCSILLVCQMERPLRYVFLFLPQSLKGITTQPLENHPD